MNRGCLLQGPSATAADAERIWVGHGVETLYLTQFWSSNCSNLVEYPCVKYLRHHWNLQSGDRWHVNSTNFTLKLRWHEVHSFLACVTFRMQYPAAGTDLQVLLTTASTGTTWPTCADSRLSTTISGSISIVTTDGTIAGTNPTECWECVFF
jgi:hypothetical protein